MVISHTVADTLTSGSHPDSNMPGRRREDDTNLVAVGALRQHVRPGSNTDHTVHQGQTVRRLTPTECERLQALPDGWTQLDDKTPDSRRYAGLGDAVTASVAEWIGARIMVADGTTGDFGALRDPDSVAVGGSQ